MGLRTIAVSAISSLFLLTVRCQFPFQGPYPQLVLPPFPGGRTLPFLPLPPIFIPSLPQLYPAYVRAGGLPAPRYDQPSRTVNAVAQPSQPNEPQPGGIPVTLLSWSPDRGQKTEDITNKLGAGTADKVPVVKGNSNSVTKTDSNIQSNKHLDNVGTGNSKADLPTSTQVTDKGLLSKISDRKNGQNIADTNNGNRKSKDAVTSAKREPTKDVIVKKTMNGKANGSNRREQKVVAAGGKVVGDVPKVGGQARANAVGSNNTDKIRNIVSAKTVSSEKENRLRGIGGKISNNSQKQDTSNRQNARLGHPIHQRQKGKVRIVPTRERRLHQRNGSTPGQSSSQPQPKLRRIYVFRFKNNQQMEARPEGRGGYVRRYNSRKYQHTPRVVVKPSYRNGAVSNKKLETFQQKTSIRRLTPHERKSAMKKGQFSRTSASSLALPFERLSLKYPNFLKAQRDGKRKVSKRIKFKTDLETGRIKIKRPPGFELMAEPAKTNRSQPKAGTVEKIRRGNQTASRNGTSDISNGTANTTKANKSKLIEEIGNFIDLAQKLNINLGRLLEDRGRPSGKRSMVILPPNPDTLTENMKSGTESASKYIFLRKSLQRPVK